jgi:hypothetical protein
MESVGIGDELTQKPPNFSMKNAQVGSAPKIPRFHE